MEQKVSTHFPVTTTFFKGLGLKTALAVGKGFNPFEKDPQKPCLVMPFSKDYNSESVLDLT